MRWDISGSWVAYAVPAALFAVAFVIKLPLLRRAWQDPILRATAVLLGIGTLVFVSLPPANLHRINVLTGVPNFAALWVCSLATAYCGACLWLIITWREPPSAARRRRTRQVGVAYAAVIAGLCTTFLLGDHRVERLRDLDTYYAGTPWMREFILLYVVAHTASALVAAGLLRAWYREVEDTWLRRAVIFLQEAYALGLLFDVAKLAAVAGRWSGRDWDWLSTYAAPPFAIAEAGLVAVAFIVGQAGPLLAERRRLVRDHRRLKPLWQTMLTITPPAAPAVGRVSGAALRLELRRATINDGLLKLGPYLSESRRERTRCAATAAGYPESVARGIAGAVDLRFAAAALHAPDDRPGLRPEDGSAGFPCVPDSELQNVSHALRTHEAAIERFHRQALAAEGLDARDLGAPA
ncbi:MAB_1171c family putative transporter [Streptomyces sp. SCL15-4]|uniref:MAB_1171c family putative transporter n=1 Tax=Streptomyces sp. SCL15-4 TaxID=2967221 RepID=UPI0029667570|nr:MAB_1171c family putative transporter [Streptomyces sp. SCL15-4]